MRALLVLSLALLGCPGASTTSLDCVAAALRDADGQPDGCDLAACVQCVDACGADCLVQESYPPRYVCPSASWDVYDVCPAWSGPPVAPTVTDVVELGCGVPGEEELRALPTGPGRISVLHLDYAEGCCPRAVDVALAASGTTLTVTYTPLDDVCDCVCDLDVSYDVVGLTAGPWTLVAGPHALTTTVEVE